MKEYDPNMGQMLKMVEHKVALTFQSWQYKTTVETTVSTNQLGFPIVELALEKIESELMEMQGSDYPELKLYHNDESLAISNSDGETYDWLSASLVAYEVISAKELS